MPLEKSPLHGSPARVVALADQCVQCGLCLPVCPTYALDQNEAESPRGRIAIASALARGLADPTRELREHLDHCLGCLNCEKVCPAHVEYDELLIETRTLLGAARHRPPSLIRFVLTRPRWLRAARHMGRWIALPHWKAWLSRQFPPSSPWRSALLLLPSKAPAARPKTSRARQTEAERLALFTGCVASVEDATAQQAALVLLRAAGFQVDLLPAFCCGAMDLHDGERPAAQAAAQRVRTAWESSGATRLLSVTPGCLGTLRRALPDAEVIDPLALLAERAESLNFWPLAEKIALHVPCTQSNVAGTEAALLSLLRRIPRLEVMPLPRPPHCCGAAGSHMLEYPDRADRLRDMTLRHVSTLHASQMLSSNIGCRLHLSAGITQQGLNLPTQHPLTLLARQLVDADQ